MYMQGYYSGDLILTFGGMTFWFRDIGNEASCQTYEDNLLSLFIPSEYFY